MQQSGMELMPSPPPTVVVVSPDGTKPPSLSPYHPRLITDDLSEVCPTDDVVVLYSEQSAPNIGRLHRMLGRGMPAVMVTARGFDEQDVIGAFDYGATSYLLVDEVARYCLVDAANRTAAGESCLSPRVATVLLRHLNRSNLTMAFDQSEADAAELLEVAPAEQAGPGNLTARERQIMELLVIGHTIAEIAAHLGLVKKTVRNNLSNIYAKLQVGRQSEAILLWLGHDRRQPRPASASVDRRAALWGRSTASVAVG